MAHNKLKGRMREYGITVTKAAEAAGCSPGTMSNKLNDIHPFTVKEVFALIGLLGLTAEDIPEYFY